MDENSTNCNIEDSGIGHAPNRSEPAMEDYFEYAVSKLLWIYVSPVLLGLGTVGNLLSILVLCRHPIWRLSTSPFFVSLALADMFVLYTGLLRRWLLHLYDVDIRVLSDVGCRIHVFCVYASLHFSAWVLVLVTLSRFLSVCFPLKAKTICTRKKSKLSICVAFVAILVVNLHELIARQFQNNYVSGPNGTFTVKIICGHISSGYAEFFKNIWPWIDLGISSGVPFAVIIVCNSCIVWKVIVSHRFGKKALTRVNRIQDRRVSSMTVVLLVLNTVFLVTTAPSRIFLIGSPAWHEEATPHKEAVLQLFWALVNLLMYMNNAVNFILYCVSGTQFRNELKSLILWGKSQVYPIRPKTFDFPGKTAQTSSPTEERRTNALHPYQEWTRY